MEYFWDEVIRRGGKIRGIQVYETKQTDFVAQFESFIGKNRYISEEEKSYLEEFKENQQPIRDFEAIFIPIEGRGTTAFKALLPYTTLFKIDDILFIGDSGWNAEAVAFALKKGNRDSIFVDNFFKQSDQSEVQDFVKLHKKYYFKHLNYLGPKPYTAFAYDTVQILRKLLKEPENRTHEGFQKALSQMEPFEGVTGNITFLKNGDAHREPKLLMIKADKIISVN